MLALSWRFVCSYCTALSSKLESNCTYLHCTARQLSAPLCTALHLSAPFYTSLHLQPAFPGSWSSAILLLLVPPHPPRPQVCSPPHYVSSPSPFSPSPPPQGCSGMRRSAGQSTVLVGPPTALRSRRWSRSPDWSELRSLSWFWSLSCSCF